MKYKNIIILLICIIISGFISINLGFDWDWDVRNYHLYNPYAFLNNRIGYDIMPASIMSYYNPLLDTFCYLLIKYLNHFPNIVGFIFGISYGLLVFISYKISDLIFQKHKYRIFLSIFTTVISAASINLFFSTGRLTHDLIIAFFILCGIWFIFKAIETKPVSNIIISGLILGCACGLKYTTVPFAIALLFTILIFNKKLFSNPYKLSGIFLLCGVIGFLITNGFWMYKLYTVFGNPVMPHFSEIFHNDWINRNITVQGSDVNSFHPVLFRDFWKVPFTIEDLRFPVIFGLFLINLFLRKKINTEEIKELHGINFKYTDFILLFCILSGIFMYKFFYDLRYLAAISALSGIILITYTMKILLYLRLKYFSNSQKFFNIFTGIILFICSITIILNIQTNSISEQKRSPVNKKGNVVFLSQNAKIPDNAVVITKPGCGCIIPFQNPSARFIYFSEDRFLERHIQIFSDKGYEKLREYIKKQPDNVFILSNTQLNDLSSGENLPATIKSNNELYTRYKIIKQTTFEELERYNISENTIEQCKIIKTMAEDYYLCKINFNKGTN